MADSPERHDRLNPTPLERVRSSAEQIAHGLGLNETDSLNLGQFANVLARIQAIKRDFFGTTTESAWYPLGLDENELPNGLRITRDEYPTAIMSLSTRALELHLELVRSRDAREAEALVVRDVLDLFPPSF